MSASQKLRFTERLRHFLSESKADLGEITTIVSKLQAKGLVTELEIALAAFVLSRAGNSDREAAWNAVSRVSGYADSDVRVWLLEKLVSEQ